MKNAICEAQQKICKYINGAKGAVALFLAILMVPFATIAASLINAGRINSAVAIFDEALCNASNSALGTYDEFLRSRFALMAMSQNTASGGTQYGHTSGGYTPEDLVSDVFNYYMEKNVGALSNTYNATDINAVGVYPLADTSVLLAGVLQASKVTVPAKLAIDWGSLDDMINKLTKPLKMVGDVESLLGGGADVVADIDDLNEKKDDLKTKIDDCNTARSEYDSAYSEFVSAANEFNTLIDNINAAQNTYNQKKTTYESKKSAVEELERQLQEKRERLQEMLDDTEHDYSAEIEELEEEIADLEEEIEEKSPGYETAFREYEQAGRTLQNYKDQFDGKRESVVTKKADYYTKIVALRDAIDKTCKAAVKFQDAAKSLASDAEGLITDTATVALDVAKSNNEKQQKELQQEADESVLHAHLAEMDGYPEFNEYFNKIKQDKESGISNLKEDAISMQNKEKIVEGLLDSAKSVNNGLVEFADRNLEAEYQVIYSQLDQLRIRVNDRAVPQSYNKLNYSDFYYQFSNPVNKAEVDEIIDNIEDEISNNAGWAMLKALVSFVKALFKLSVLYDPELKSTVNESLYAPNGGLPSKIDRSIHSLDSPYADEDLELSNSYRTILNTYSSEQIYSTEVLAPSSFERMMGYIDQLMKLLGEFKLSKLKEIFNTAGSIIDELCQTSFADLIEGLAKSIMNKALLVGYISYNTANRTTYSGKALTGAKFGLPSTEATKGYVFSGAETEYIYNGSTSEVENQKSAFRALWIMRMLMDLPAIFTDYTVESLATGVGSVTFGLGTIIVYAVFIAAEGVVDTIILANSGTIPMIKSFVYLTPQGLPKLIQALTSLTLNKSLQKTIYEKSTACAEKMEKQLDSSKVSYPSFDDYQSQSKAADDKFSNIFTWDYTKSLQLILLLTRRSSTMLNRLADIVEMEAAYNAQKGAATYLFNLDKSFTYLRASGNFTSNVFIKISEESDLTSKKRVIYNGY